MTIVQIKEPKRNVTEMGSPSRAGKAVLLASLRATFGQVLKHPLAL